MPAPEQNRDLTMTPGTYAYLQNEGKGGLITIHVGPTVINQTGQDRPVVYNPKERSFRACNLENAVQPFIRVQEDEYMILENPVLGSDGKPLFPTEAQQQAKKLEDGRKVSIIGPISCALWPGQSAKVVQGHRLRSNQYLVVSIYNSEEAAKNWAATKVEAAKVEKGEGEEQPKKQEAKAMGLPRPDSFAVGTRIVIKGTDVSYYVPPTGVEVLMDENNGQHVREAVTLEQLQYCCLVDETGKREYPRGPQVVFPKATQIFQIDSKQNRKFRPIELNDINGIHVKVTASYEDEDLESPPGPDGKRPKRQYQEGEELFITGKTLQIYYPREEHSIIEYGLGNKKHYSIAIPEGEARYVINRKTGEITTYKGPAMLLPDPRTQIIVRRILTTDECRTWYPGNEEALSYNLGLAQTMAESPSGRSGLVSEGDYQRGMRNRGLVQTPQAASSGFEGADYSAFQTESVGEAVAHTTQRGTKFTEPRKLTLNTKYDGVPKVEIWPGFAVLIVGATGKRRVEVGPQTVLLNYDEKLGHMSLSTGKPKSTDNLLKTSYLCILHNQVGDIVPFESKDHVKGNVKISLRVDFEGSDREKWFSVDNYVKFLTDHVRSILSGVAKRHSVAELKSNYVDIVRSAILGHKPQGGKTGESEPLNTKRPGLPFDANGMRVVEVEVLALTLEDVTIAKLLDAAQHNVVKSDIEITQAHKDLDTNEQKEKIAQDMARAKHSTAKLMSQLESDRIKDTLGLKVEQFLADLEISKREFEIAEAKRATADLQHAAELSRQKNTETQQLVVLQERQQLQIGLMNAEADAVVKRFDAAKNGLCETLVALQRDDIAIKLAEATNIERYLTGGNLESSLTTLLSFIPTLGQFMEQGNGVANGNGKNRLGHKEKVPTT